MVMGYSCVDGIDSDDMGDGDGGGNGGADRDDGVIA
jgi:hypothetical protein